MGIVSPCYDNGCAGITSQWKMPPTFSTRRPFRRTSIVDQWCGSSSSMHSLFCERKLLHVSIIIGICSFKLTVKNIMVKPTNVKEFDNFFGRSIDHLPIFVQFRPFSVQNEICSVTILTFFPSSMNQKVVHRLCRWQRCISDKMKMTIS